MNIVVVLFYPTVCSITKNTYEIFSFYGFQESISPTDVSIAKNTCKKIIDTKNTRLRDKRLWFRKYQLQQIIM